jgi:hypothetical protein
MKRRFLALALLLPLAGCDDGNTELWLGSNNLLPMVALADRVALVEGNSQTAFVLDPADPSLTPRQVPVGKAPVVAVKRNGSNKLLVLSQGDPGTIEKLPVAAELDVIDADPQMPIERYPLDGRFDSLTQSADGRFLILYHSPGAQSESGSALYDPNELLIVDFNKAVPLQTGKSIRSLGGVPSEIFFSPSYALPGGRNLAVVLSQNYVTILDLDHPDRTEISVPLCPQSTGCNVSPKQIAFDPVNLNIFVCATGAKDIFQIALTDLGVNAPAPPSNDFHTSASMLAVGSVPADMVLYGSGDDTRLAVAAPDTRSLVIVDPKTSHTTTVTTSIPVNQIIPFTIPGTKPTDPWKPQALLIDRLLGSTSVLFADLPNVEVTGGLALKDFTLGTPARTVRPLVDQGMVVLMSDSLSGNSALTVVDLPGRSFKQIGSGGWLAYPTVETLSPSRLWGVDSGSRLCYLNLMPRAKEPVGTGETWLDQNIVSITPLTVRSADGIRYLVVGQHDPNSIGNLTFLDADNPDRAAARTAYGFLLTNYLEREQP